MDEKKPAVVHTEKLTRLRWSRKTIIHRKVSKQDRDGLLETARSRVWATAQTWMEPDYRKRYRAWLFQGYILASLIAFVILAVFARLATHFDFDLEITLALQNSIPRWFGTLLYWVSWPGYVTGTIVGVGGVIGVLTLFGLRWESLIAILTAGSAALINNLIKFSIRRPRPDDSLVDVFQSLPSFSFPSGHVMFYTAFYGFMAFLCFTLIRRSWLRIVLVSLFSLLVLLVGLSRVYLGEHWASDVIGAYLLGFLNLIAAIRIYRWGQQRRINQIENQND
jgi:undecaprenyl-diphosphatase